MSTLVEGVESMRLACNLVLLIPAAAIVLLGPRRRWLVPAWVGVVAGLAWCQFAGWLDSAPTELGVVAGLVAVGATVWIARRPLPRYAPVADAVLTTSVAVAAVWPWIPCVGPRLGDILNHARSEPWAQLVPTVAYFAGLFLAVIVAAAGGSAWPRLVARVDARGWIRSVGVAALGLVGALASLGLYDDLAAELARRSTW